MANIKILLAEDDSNLGFVIKDNLGDRGYDITHCLNGLDAEHATYKDKYDLYLLDVMMPKLNGFEVCRKLKSDKATSKIMILMVTALSELGDIERAVEAGTDDFLSKPVNSLELQKRVANMLKLKGTEDELERLRAYIREMEETK